MVVVIVVVVEVLLVAAVVSGVEMSRYIKIMFGFQKNSTAKHQSPSTGIRTMAILDAGIFEPHYRSMAVHAVYIK